MGRIIGNQRGMALILTIVIVSLLVVATVRFGLGMRREYLASANLQDAAVADGIALGGVNIATEILEWDGRTTGFDSFQSAWNTVSGRDLSSLFDQGRLHLTITDLSGRLQINSLVSDHSGKGGANTATAMHSREILQRLLVSGRFGDVSEDQAREIVDSLVDWIDVDNRESPYGAEDGYYQSLTPPYHCKNGPVTFVQELLLVRGITRNLLFGTADHPGLAAYITVHGDDGRININTAAPALLQAMNPEMTEETAKEMVDFRSDEKNTLKLSQPTWYKDIPGWPTGLRLDPHIVTTKSSYFRITSVGLSRRLTEVEEVEVYREKNNKIDILNTKVE